MHAHASVSGNRGSTHIPTQPEAAAAKLLISVPTVVHVGNHGHVPDVLLLVLS